MNRVAAFQAAICTLAVGAISAGTSTFVMATNSGELSVIRTLAAVGSLAVGSYLVYLGHCRSLLPGK